jgi:hypothetical protein
MGIAPSSVISMTVPRISGSAAAHAGRSKGVTRGSRRMFRSLAKPHRVHANVVVGSHHTTGL